MGYSLLKRQHKTRTKAILPPVSDFTSHYRSHYELGDESPLDLQTCELPPSTNDDTLTRDEFDAGVRCLNSNRSSGHDNVAPEYIKHGGTTLLQWTFVLMTRIWSFACDLPAIDRIGTLLLIPKQSGGGHSDFVSSIMRSSICDVTTKLDDVTTPSKMSESI